MIEAIKAPIRRRWPRLHLRTILLLTFVVVAALPGFGALFLRVYENTLVRQTEAELIAQSAALAAVTGAEWPGSAGPYAPPPTIDPRGMAGGTLSTIDLRGTPVLPERPPPVAMTTPPQPDGIAAAVRIAPILQATAQSTLASILLLDAQGRILTGPDAGRGYPQLPEVVAARSGQPIATLRRRGGYRARYTLEWLSRASDLRIHYARPVIVNRKVVAVLLLSRSPRALFRGLYEDRGKILFGIAVILAILVLLSGLLSRGIARPIVALSEATRQLARGGGHIPEAPQTAAIEIQSLYVDFARMADATERRSRYLRDFAHAMSHEFKTPLAGIRGAVELLMDHHATMSDAEKQRFLINVNADAQRLTQLVTRLLELARADMAEVDRSASTDLGQILHRIADAHGAAVPILSVASPPDLPNVAMPAAMLDTIVAGLVENSRQAGARRVNLTGMFANGTIVLAVMDDGPGVPPADRKRIFEPFFTSRRASGGTGLGLAIARSLLESYGGSIDLIADARGAAFALNLPARS